MKIADSTIQLASSRSAQERDEKRESLQMWRDGEPSRQVTASDGMRGAQALAASLQGRSVRVTVSGQAQALQPMKAKAVEKSDSQDEPIGDLKFLLLKTLVEHLTGKELKLLQPGDVQDPCGCNSDPANTPAPGTAAQPSDREGWGVVYDYYESHYESEQVSFSAQGVVRTADGKEIDISLELNMSREFYTQQHLSLRAGDALKDPLVINFSGTAAQLTQRDFSFDIDADGRTEQISFVQPGSGFLALDQNGDGTINDGSELFGPQSGNGFGELAKYDADQNGWIDENDAIYDRLRIWSKDAAGNDQLVALGERGIGAIYLGNVDTQFLVKDSANDTLGAVRQSGIFLQEEGGAGTIQQLDLVV